MKKLSTISISAFIAFSTLPLSASTYLIKGSPEIGNWSNPSTWIAPDGKAVDKIPAADDSVATIDASRGIKIDGNYTIKSLLPSRYTSSCTGELVPFIMGEGQSLTIDAKLEKAKNVNIILCDYTTLKNDSAQSPLKEQGIIFKGGKLFLRNSGNPGGAINVVVSAMANPKTNPDFLSRLVFGEDCHLKVLNTFIVHSANKVYRRDFAFQNSAVDFLGRTDIYAESKGKKYYKDLRVPRLYNDSLNSLLTLNIGNSGQLSKPLNQRARMESGNLLMENGSELNVYGTYIVNGNANFRLSKLNVHKGAKMTITSANCAKASIFNNKPETIVNIGGTLEILNPKYPATSADFNGGIFTIESGGLLKVQGSGTGGKCFVMISGGSINIKDGGKLYARNMLRIGENGIVRLYGENQISAMEPANGKCRMLIRGKNARLFIYANQDMDSLLFQKHNGELTITLGDNVKSLKFVKLVSGNWFPKATIAFNNFRNGLITVSEPNEAAICASNISAKGWKNFRFEKKDGVYALVADKE